MMPTDDRGFSLVEVVVAMSISMVVVMGGMAALHVSARLTQEGVMKTRALSLAQGRLEAKRSVRWEAMLQDDLDHDGRTDVVMADDGQGADVSEEDGIYTGQWEHDGISLTWTVVMDRLADLDVPVLALAGTLDRPEYAASGQYLERKMPDARLLVVEGGEHNMQETHAADIAAAIEEFVREKVR